MTINPAALKAYANAAAQFQGGAGPAGTSAASVGGPSFGQVLRAAAQSTVAAQHNLESVALQHSVGKADLLDVVQAASSAEVSLRSAVAVRDKVVQAYQEIMRMPI